MVPRNSIQLLNMNTTKFQVEREPVYVYSKWVPQKCNIIIMPNLCVCIPYCNTVTVEVYELMNEIEDVSWKELFSKSTYVTTSGHDIKLIKTPFN